MHSNNDDDPQQTLTAYCLLSQVTLPEKKVVISFSILSMATTTSSQILDCTESLAGDAELGGPTAVKFIR